MNPIVQNNYLLILFGEFYTSSDVYNSGQTILINLYFELLISLDFAL